MKPLKCLIGLHQFSSYYEEVEEDPVRLRALEVTLRVLGQKKTNMIVSRCKKCSYVFGGSLIPQHSPTNWDITKGINENYHDSIYPETKNPPHQKLKVPQ